MKYNLPTHERVMDWNDSSCCYLYGTRLNGNQTEENASQASPNDDDDEDDCIANFGQPRKSHREIEPHMSIRSYLILNEIMSTFCHRKCYLLQNKCNRGSILLAPNRIGSIVACYKWSCNVVHVSPSHLLARSL